LGLVVSLHVTQLTIGLASIVLYMWWQVQEAEASKLVDNGQIDGRMTATLTYPGSSSSSAGSLAAGAEGRMEADLRHDGLWPVTKFVATGTQ
jgi:hypothetical protein